MAAAALAGQAAQAVTLIITVGKDIIGFARDGSSERATLNHRLTRLVTYCVWIREDLAECVKKGDVKAIRCLAAFCGTADYLMSLFPNSDPADHAARKKAVKDFSRIANNFSGIAQQLDLQWKELVDAYEALHAPKPRSDGMLGIGSSAGGEPAIKLPAAAPADPFVEEGTKFLEEW